MRGLRVDDFRLAVNRKLNESEKSGADYIDIRSGDLHRELRDYPGPNHRMPVCCDAMYSIMSIDDVILQAPKKGRGANLVIRYTLPRPSEKAIGKKLQEISPDGLSEDIVFQELERLNNYSNTIDAEKLNQLIRINPNTAILKIRTIAEKCAKNICEKNGHSCTGLSFHETCSQLNDYSILDDRYLGYLNMIRIFGNIAAHDDTVSFTKKDALIIGNLLCEFLDGAFEKKYL